MYLVDTNICIALLKNNRQAVTQLNRFFPQCYVPSLVLAELYKGAYCSKLVERNLDALDEITELLPVIPFDRSAAVEFGIIQSELRQIGKPTGEIDALLAAIARSRQDVLVTDNIRHFENISDLTLSNWLAE
ncbi:MAG: type II toxin-antitoxin system VapC family toxin [Cyanobacteria bacterium P01_E01_bin.6]